MGCLSPGTLFRIDKNIQCVIQLWKWYSKFDVQSSRNKIQWWEENTVKESQKCLKVPESSLSNHLAHIENKLRQTQFSCSLLPSAWWECSGLCSTSTLTLMYDLEWPWNDVLHHFKKAELSNPYVGDEKLASQLCCAVQYCCDRNTFI